jgi:hypothetical protein
MTSYVLKNSIHTAVCETLIADIRAQRSSFYFFVGGLQLPGVNISTDADPSYAYELDARNEIVSLKKLQSSDVSFVIPRVNWVSGTVYDYYDDYSPSFPSYSGATDISQAKFYVMNSQFNVYKCLSNNVNGPSTVEPTSTLAAPFYTADGYRWKYMYAIPLSMRNRFLNSAYMPVQTALLDQFYSAGQIVSKVILNPGTGYVQASTSIVVEGDGTGAVLTPVVSNGQIVQVIVNNPGSGYTYANLTVEGVGSGAEIVADLSVGDLDTSQADVELLAVPGSLEAYRITDQGFGYTQATVSITGDGTGATAHVQISNNRIVALIVDNPGQGYTTATVTITGDGLGATAIPIIAPWGGHGKNAVNELYAQRLSFFSNLLNDKNQGLQISNQFRQIGILRAPTAYGSDQLYTSLNASALMLINFSGPAPSNNDVLAEQNTGKRFRVIQVTGTQMVVQNLDNFALQGNSVLLNQNSGSQVGAVTIVNPQIDKFSGDLLFIDNFAINQQAGQQIIIFKTTLKF